MQVFQVHSDVYRNSQKLQDEPNINFLCLTLIRITKEVDMIHTFKDFYLWRCQMMPNGFLKNVILYFYSLPIDDNFACFCRLRIFFKIAFFEKLFQ